MSRGLRDLIVLLLAVAVFGAVMAWRKPPEPVANTSPTPRVEVPVVVTATPVVITPTPVAVKPKPLARKPKPPAPPVYYPPPTYQNYRAPKPPNGKYEEGGDSLIVH